MRLKYSTRIVVILNDVVIKIPISRKGFLQGLNEKFIWDKYNKIAPLAELKWMCLGVVCQKKYANVEFGIVPFYSIRQIKAVIPELDFKNCDLHNYENWGWTTDDKFILLDYGVNEYISTLYKLK
jgi:hypothetical protein|tara:strand:+ start:371 stop:745 length:375 start_codon:yes stop_codon:yes gene_type:complete